MSIWNFLLSWVEHENFKTSGQLSADNVAISLTIWRCSWKNFSKKFILKKFSRRQQKHEKLPNLLRVKKDVYNNLTLKEPRNYASENVVCWSHMLHIIAYIIDKLSIEANNLDPK